MATQYPFQLDSTTNIPNIVDLASPTTLSQSIGITDSTINVVSTSGYPINNGLIVIDKEQIFYTGSTPTSFTGCTRAANGTLNISHVAGVVVQSLVTASAYTNLRDAILQVESVLGVGGANIVGAVPPLITVTQLLKFASDTGISRTAAGKLAIGNGNASDSSGSLRVGTGAFNNVSIGDADTIGFWFPGFLAVQGGSGADTAVFDTAGFRVAKTFTIGWAAIGGATASGADTTLSRTAAGVVAVGNGTSQDTSGQFIAANFQTSNNGQFNLFETNGNRAVQIISTGTSPTATVRMNSSSLLGWTANSSASVAADSGISRTGIGVMGIGNGTQGDTSGNLQLNQITKYLGVATVGAGVPVLVAKVDLAAQSASIPSTTIYAIPASGAGTYRMTCYAVITQVATTSSTLPSVGLVFTDQDTNTTFNPGVTATSTNNTLGTNSTFVGAAGTTTITFQARASTNIQYQLNNYASSGATAMQYAAHIKLEYLGA
jgi:hypothetical protein